MTAKSKIKLYCWEFSIRFPPRTDMHMQSVRNRVYHVGVRCVTPAFYDQEMVMFEHEYYVFGDNPC